MNDPTDERIQFEDMTATELKRRLGQTLDEVLQGSAVRISRHGRKGQRLVLIRESDLERLQVQRVRPLDALRDRFDKMLADMQTSEARAAIDRVNDAATEELGAAAIEAHRTGG